MLTRTCYSKWNLRIAKPFEISLLKNKFHQYYNSKYMSLLSWLQFFIPQALNYDWSTTYNVAGWTWKCLLSNQTPSRYIPCFFEFRPWIRRRYKKLSMMLRLRIPFLLYGHRMAHRIRRWCLAIPHNKPRRFMQLVLRIKSKSIHLMNFINCTVQYCRQVCITRNRICLQ